MSAIDCLTNPVMKAFLAGSLSGTCSTLLFQPLDLVKTRVQQQAGGAGGESMVRVVRGVVNQDNVRGLWRGVMPSMVRTGGWNMFLIFNSPFPLIIVPGVGLYFSSMHYMKTTLCQGRPSHVESILIGCSARTFAGSIMIPFTVIKIRCSFYSHLTMVYPLLTILTGLSQRTTTTAQPSKL